MTRRIRILDVKNTAASAKEILLYRVKAANEYHHFENWIVCGPGEHVKTLREHGIPVHTIESPRGIGLKYVSPLSLLIAFWRLLQFIREGRFDIVHTHGPIHGFIGRLAAWLAGVPVIVHVEHGSIYYEHQNPLLRRLFMLADRFIAQFTDHLLYENPFEMRFAIEHKLTGRAQVHFVGSGINLDDFRMNQRETPASAAAAAERARQGKLVIAHVARLDPIKNQTMLLQAVARLKRVRSDFELWVIGDGILREKLEAMSDDLGIRGVVRFFGYRDDVPALLAQADVAALTSLKEGIPRGLMEPMAMGLPVVATNVKGNRETVVDGETGFLVPLGDVEAFADRLALLLDNADLRRRMGERGHHRVLEQFDERTMIGRIMQVYLNLYPAPVTETVPVRAKTAVRPAEA